MQTFIKDIFGNPVEVVNLEKAFEQTKLFIEYSKVNPLNFSEYKIISTADQFGKPTTITQTKRNGKTVTALEFYFFQLEQLKKLTIN